MIWRKLFLVVICSCFSSSIAVASSAVFQVEIEVSWSVATHPVEFPPSAHLSDAITATHRADYVMFTDGNTATSGLELLAENGRLSVLQAELDEATRRARVGRTSRIQGIGNLPGRMVGEISADAQFPYLSLVTMIAPSPDWFTGVTGVNLVEDSKWIRQLELPLWAWDAGTDSGLSYTSPDIDTQPKSAIRLVATHHFLQPTGLVRVGTLKIELLRVEP